MIWVEKADFSKTRCTVRLPPWSCDISITLPAMVCSHVAKAQRQTGSESITCLLLLNARRSWRAMHLKGSLTLKSRVLAWGASLSFGAAHLP